MNPTPHDSLVRAIFGQPQHAAAELRAALPPDALAQLDLASLAAVNASFIDDALRASCADLLFEARTRDGAPLLVYFLIEHQSTPDPRMPLRLLSYLTRIWERHAAAHPDAIDRPPIVPLLIHQGPRPWPWPPRFGSSMSDAAPLLLRHGVPLLDFGFIVDDLATQSDAQLLARGHDAIARLAWLALRHGRDGGRLVELMAGAFRALERDLRGPEAGPALAKLARYVCDVSEEPTMEVIPVLAAALSCPARSELMTVSDQLRAEGRVEAFRESLLDQIEIRFGAADAATRQRIATAGSDQLRAWLRKFAVAKSLAEVFAG